MLWQESRGYETSCPCLLTYNAAPSPPGPLISLANDVTTVQAELRRLVEEEEKVIDTPQKYDKNFMNKPISDFHFDHG